MLFGSNDNSVILLICVVICVLVVVLAVVVAVFVVDISSSDDDDGNSGVVLVGDRLLARFVEYLAKSWRNKSNNCWLVYITPKKETFEGRR